MADDRLAEVTQRYLWPALRAAGVPDVEWYTVTWAEHVNPPACHWCGDRGTINHLLKNPGPWQYPCRACRETGAEE